MKLPLFAAAMMALSAPGQAALFNFSGSIINHSDVVYVSFTLDNDTTGVRVWTDSYKNGLNFDPITMLWGSNGVMIAGNQDNPRINPDTQTAYDSGFVRDLAAGSYTVTLGAANNFEVSAGHLSEGFVYDSETPVPIFEWNQPWVGAGRLGGWSIWLDGVDSASGPLNTVPEPSALALLAVGALGGLAMRRRKAG